MPASIHTSRFFVDHLSVKLNDPGTGPEPPRSPPAQAEATGRLIPKLLGESDIVGAALGPAG